MNWKKKTFEEIKSTIIDALELNVDYKNGQIIGLPGSHLDEKVFSRDTFNLLETPFLHSLLLNPNHIGCHTLGSSESFFKGTQELEKEVISICAQEILKGGEEQFDGYVAAGGTEANMQAVWVYRNFYQVKRNASSEQIALFSSSDSHYSMAKAVNVFAVKHFAVRVNSETRALDKEDLENKIISAKNQGVKYVIVVANMMTTMFGSVDNVNLYIELFKKHQLEYKIHIDGAYGGFYYPFSNEKDELMNFANPEVTSVTLDAHKMAQAPYGTGIFLIRKNYIHYATTKEASYIEGEDCTLIGSRSGANAISIWMILFTYGHYGWKEKMLIIQNRTDRLCQQLDELSIDYFRNQFSNIVTMNASQVSTDLAEAYGLIPDNHHRPSWYKIVVMEHVTMDKLEDFLEAFKKELERV